MRRILSQEQLAEYDELGFVHSIPVLSEEEVRRYRAEVEQTCAALGGGVTRLDGLHLFFRWAWDLCTHPRLLNCMEQLLGPDILLKSTRLFYKPGRSNAFVGWHQDGITERLADARVPAVWLGLTEATIENGCLRVAPRSHRLGLIPHAPRPHADNLTTEGVTAQTEVTEAYDIVMRPGEMSLHHPLILHASNPNRSDTARIGFTATYTNRALQSSRTAVAWVRGDGPRDLFEMAEAPPAARPLEESLAAYRARDHQIRFDSQDPDGY